MHVIQEPNKQVEERICIFNKIKNFLDCNSFKRSVSILLGIAETLWGDSAETQGSGEWILVRKINWNHKQSCEASLAKYMCYGREERFKGKHCVYL